MDDLGRMAVMTESREQAIRDLTKHCGDGRLTLGELEERIDEVNRATTDDEIRHALRELPVVAHEPLFADEDDVADPDAADAPAGAARSVALPASAAARRACERSGQHGVEKTLRAVWAISGLIALFNGLWWVAIILWFVVPKLVLPNLRRI